MADGTFPAKPRVRDARFEGYCEGCNSLQPYNRLNDAMLCEACGEPDTDPESVIDLSDGAMRAEHSTYGRL